MITGRYSHRVYVAYTTVSISPHSRACIKLHLQVYCLGTILSMQISFVGFQPVQSSEHMAVSNICNTVMIGRVDLHLQYCSLTWPVRIF